MNQDFFIVPQRQSRAWWDMDETGHLTCSVCGANATGENLAVCPGCGSNMTVDEEWTKRILERGYKRKKG